MKLKFLTFLALTLFFNLYNVHSQELQISEITDNLDELFINKDNPYRKIPEKAVDLYIDDISRIYYFQIEYNNNIIFREVIKKSVPQSTNMEIVANQFRFKYNKIYLDASLINDSDKLKLLESYMNKIINVAGKKMINLGDYEIIKNDYKQKKYVVNNPLENMKIKIFKVEFE